MYTHPRLLAQSFDIKYTVPVHIIQQSTYTFISIIKMFKCITFCMNFVLFYINVVHSTHTQVVL